MGKEELYRGAGVRSAQLLLTAAVAMALAVLLAGFAPQVAWADENGLVEKDGVYQYLENGNAVKSTWKKVGKSKYYFDAKGNAVVGKAAKIKDKYYIFGDNGKLLTPKKSKVYQLKGGVFYVNKKGQPADAGWCVVSDRLYKVGKSGKCVTNKTVQGIKLQANGAAKNDKSTELKMYCMLIIDKVTTDGMTKKQKLRKCFDFVLKSSKYANSQEPKDIGKKGWAQRAALKVLQRKKYDCLGFACTILAFAYELGYKPTIRGKALKHAYCLINGKAYDMVGPRFGTKPIKVKGAKTWKFNTWDASQPVVKQKGWVDKGSARYYYGANNKPYTGSHKIKGVYYVFDKKGKLLTGEKTRTVKVSGDTYRVDKRGKAVAGWTKNKKTLYLSNGRMATGLTVYQNKNKNKNELYWFSGKGVQDNAKSKKIRAAAKINKNASDLIGLIGKPVKSKTEASCNPTFVEKYPKGKDLIMTFKNAKLEFFACPDGTKYLTNISTYLG